MSGPHLSDAARRAGPARQRAVAAWLPHAVAACLMRAAFVPTAPRAARPTASRPPPHASPVTPPSRLSRAPTACVPTNAVRSRGARTTAVPPRTPRRPPIVVAPRRRPRVGEPPFLAVSRALVSCRRQLAEQRRRRAVPLPHVARAGRAGFRPRGTRLNFYIF
jgi:hypothetical protein